MSAALMPSEPFNRHRVWSITAAVALMSIPGALMAQGAVPAEGLAAQQDPAPASAEEGAGSQDSPPVDDETDEETEKRVRFNVRTQTLLYGTFVTPQESSPFNPGNRFAAIPSDEINADLRLDLSAGAGPCSAYANLRAGYDYVIDADPEPRTADRSDFFLNAGNVRCEVARGVFLSAGREVLQWGSATFLSPSNPLFIDTGKTNPLSDIYGKDIAQLTWYANERLTFSVLHNYAVGSRDPDQLNFSPLTAVKLDWIGARASGGAILSKDDDGVSRLGLYGTYTYSDALLVYADVSVGRGNSGWFPQRDPTSEWRFEQTKLNDEVFYTSLLGGAYTFESGWSLTAEWLTGNEGYGSSERRDYLAAVTQAANGFASGTNVGRSAQLLGTSLANDQRYLGSDYVFLQILRTEWNDKADVALRWSRSLGAGSGDALSASLTYYVTPSLQTFFIGTRASGGADSDFGRLIEDSALVGLRWYF